MMIRILIVLVCSAAYLSAQPQVVIRDTSVKRGEIVRVPVYVSLSADATDTIRIQVKYKRYALFLTGFQPDSKSALRVDTLEVLLPADSSALLQLTIFPIGGTLINKPLVYLNFEVLAYKDSLTKVEPQLLTINNTPLSGTVYTPATLLIPNTPPVKLLEREYLGFNSPNPFPLKTRFPYRLTERSDVLFTLFNARGSEVASYRIENQTAGLHDFDLQILPYEISSGMYHIRMVTKNGVYIQQCMVEK